MLVEQILHTASYVLLLFILYAEVLLPHPTRVCCKPAYSCLLRSLGLSLFRSGYREAMQEQRRSPWLMALLKLTLNPALPWL
jgi:hypothetical protein